MWTVSEVAPPPPGSDTWLALSGEELPTESAHRWLTRPDCGALVQFTGTARDHSADRGGVELLSYEAYHSEAIRRMEAVVHEIRHRWPDARHIVILHRTGDVEIGDAAVHVGVSAPHRDVAFEAARFGIDAVKASVPIWKRERHEAGEDWGLDGSELTEASELVPRWPAASASSRPPTGRPTALSAPHGQGGDGEAEP